MKLHKLILYTLGLVVHGVVHGQYVVMEARGVNFKSGQSIAINAEISLKEGERLVLIGGDGRSVTMRGPYAGSIPGKAASTNDAKQVLGVLLASRDARTSSVGVVRSGAASVKTPDPWAIDVTRSGARCLREGESPVLWRPEASTAISFIIFPVDRSWRADFKWEKGQDRMRLPDLSRFDGVTTLLVNLDQQEFALSFHRIPQSIQDPVILSAWMLEKSCIQQADALLRLFVTQNSIKAD